MIGIKIGDEFLEIEPGTVFQKEDINPAFEDEFRAESIPGSYNFPLDVPASPVNCRLLSHIHSISIGNDPALRSFPIQVFYKNLPFERAVVSILSTPPGRFNLLIKTGLQALSAADKELKDLDLGGDITMGATASEVAIHAENTINDTWASGGKYVFPPHRNTVFYGDVNPDFGGVVNNYDCDIEGYLFNVDGENTHCLVPFAFLFYVLQQGFMEDGLKMAGTFADDEEQQAMVLYNNFALDDFEDVTSVKAKVDTNYYNTELPHFPVESPDPWHDAGSLWDGVDYTIDRKGLIAFSWDLNMLYVYDGFSSKFRVSLFLNGVQIQTIDRDITVANGDFQNIKGTFYFQADTPDIGQPLKIQVNQYSDAHGYRDSNTYINSYVEIHNLTDEHENKYAKVMNLQNHMPQATFSELLTALRQAFNLDIFINEREGKVYLNYATDALDATAQDQTGIADPHYELLFEKPKYKSFNFTWPNEDELVQENFKVVDPDLWKGTVATFGDLPNPGSIGDFMLVRNLKKIYRVELVTDAMLNTFLSWVDFADFYYDLPVASQGADIRPALSTLFMCNCGLVRYYGTIPEVQQRGTSLAFSSGDNPVTIRLLYWRGLQPSSETGKTYPMASSTNMDFFGNTIGDYDLGWQTKIDESLWHLRWKRWALALNQGRWMRRTMYYSMHELINCPVNSRIRILGHTLLMRRRSLGLGEELQGPEVEFLPLT